jgi:sialic acid synthase SpsE
MNKIENNCFFTETQRFGPKNPLIIAELGTSHNGDIVKARELIEAAAKTGADCVKFQMVFADEILHPNTGEVPLPGGIIKLYDQFKTLETAPDFYVEIKEFVESMGLLFLCTPFGMKSASILQKIKPKIVKIASPELNFTGLLEEIAGWGLPVLLSSGVSRLSDIETAVEILRKVSLEKRKEKNANYSSLNSTDPQNLHDESSICLLHCVTSYPAPETEYNLRVLPSLAAVFGLPVGVSDHSTEPELVPALAVSMGAAVIEKHFCLSKTGSGLDDPIALSPPQFYQMVSAVRRAAQAGQEETIAHYSSERGSSLVEQILGNGVKELAPCERDNYRLTNRSIHAIRDIKAGEILKKSDYAVLRTEKILRPGMEPCWENAIEGRATKKFIPAGEGIRFEDI